MSTASGGSGSCAPTSRQPVSDLQAHVAERRWRPTSRRGSAAVPRRCRRRQAPLRPRWPPSTARAALARARRPRAGRRLVRRLATRAAPSGRPVAVARTRLRGTPRRVVATCSWSDAMGPRRIVAREGGILISFWAPGATGRMERLGHRGLDRFEADAAPTTEVIDGHAYPGRASFPVDRSLTRFHEPVDVVYTWVDGEDPCWRAEFETWRRADGPTAAATTPPTLPIHVTRRAAVLVALALAARRLGTPHLCRHGRTPAAVARRGRPAHVVGHDDAVPQRVAPDVQLPRHRGPPAPHRRPRRALPVPQRRHVPRPAGAVRRLLHGERPEPVLREQGARADPSSTPATSPSTPPPARPGAHRPPSSASSSPRKLQHAPYALRRSVLFEIEDRFPAVVERTARQRFRGPDDLSIPSAFAHHYAFCTGRAIPARSTSGTRTSADGASARSSVGSSWAATSTRSASTRPSASRRIPARRQRRWRTSSPPTTRCLRRGRETPQAERQRR